MKKLLLIFWIPIFCFSQKYKVVDPDISFFSYAPLEDITASSKELQGVIDLNTGDFFFRLPIKSFSFKWSLMQTHFNDKYMESDRFPNATFKGQSDQLKEEIKRIIQKLNEKDSDEKKSSIISKQLSDIFNQSILIEGVLNIHGQDQKIKTKVVIKSSENKISFRTIFFVDTDDFNIKIPKLLKDNISKKIEVKVSAFLKEL
tara:strand:+ start:844 stop:1449 length:606 start_codon:yes stop_codon:yes gene_type:complete